MRRSKRRVTSITRRLAVPGFISMTGTATYISKIHKLSLRVSFKRRENNYGVTPVFRETLDWFGIQKSGDIRRELESKMDDLERSLKSKSWPERGMFLEKCAGGGDPSPVLERRCPSCSCWYCELSS